MAESPSREPVSGPITTALATQQIEGQSLPASLPASLPDSGRGVNLGAAKPADMPDEVMAALDTCGQYGGVSGESGEPCDRPSSFGVPGGHYGITPGRCYQHTEEKLSLLATQKARFLQEYIDQPKTLIEATGNVGIATGLPYLWKLTDLEFRKTFEALVAIADAIRNHVAEDAMFERISDKESGADTLRMFYFQNRNNRRWRDVRKEAPSGGPVINNTGGGDVNVNVWQVGDDFIRF